MRFEAALVTAATAAAAAEAAVVVALLVVDGVVEQLWGVSLLGEGPLLEAASSLRMCGGVPGSVTTGSDEPPALRWCCN